MTGPGSAATPRAGDEAVVSLRDLQEAVVLGIATAAANFERGTGLIPQEVFTDLYADALIKVSYDQADEAWVLTTEKGASRYAEILGGDVADI